MSFSGKPTTFVEQTIENDDFWPDLSVSEFQKEQRLPAEYLVELLVDALDTAMVEVNTDLAKCKARWQGDGIARVESADSTLLPAFQVKLYKRAVYCRAKGNLLPQFTTVTRRESAENTGKEALSVPKPSWFSASRPSVPCRAVAALRRRCCDPAAGVDRLSDGPRPGDQGKLRQLDRTGQPRVDLEAWTTIQLNRWVGSRRSRRWARSSCCRAALRASRRWTICTRRPGAT